MPITDPNTSMSILCESGWDYILRVKDLTEEDLGYDPRAEPLVGTVTQDAREMFVEGEWVIATYGTRNRSGASWRVLFQFGDMESAFNGLDCVE